MCNLCSIAKNDPSYRDFVSKMVERDKEIVENTKLIAEQMPVLKELNYSSIKWPIKLFYPMFEARNSFAVPNNYFQPLFINGGKTSVFFSHGSTRSVFFSGDRLIVYSKTVNHKEGKDYFTSFVLMHFDKGEYEYGYEKGAFYIRTKLDKKLENLVTGEVESKKISFNFVHKSIENRIMTKDQAHNSTQMKQIYAKYSSLRQKLASSDMEGYVITVPHFSPHPYMLQLSQKFGYSTNREFQEKGVISYFNSHLNLSMKQ